MNLIKIYISDGIVYVEKDKQVWIDERSKELEEDIDDFEEWMGEYIHPSELFYCESWEDYQMEKAEIKEKWHDECDKKARMEFGYEWEEYTVNLDGGNI